MKSENTQLSGNQKIYSVGKNIFSFENIEERYLDIVTNSKILTSTDSDLDSGSDSDSESTTSYSSDSSDSLESLESLESSIDQDTIDLTSREPLNNAQNNYLKALQMCYTLNKIFENQKIDERYLPADILTKSAMTGKELTNITKEVNALCKKHSINFKDIKKPQPEFNIHVLEDKTFNYNGLTIDNYCAKTDFQVSDLTFDEKVTEEEKTHFKKGYNANHKKQNLFGNTWRFKYDDFTYYSHSHPYSNRKGDNTYSWNRLLVFLTFIPPLALITLPLLFRGPSERTQKNVNWNMDLLHQTIKSLPENKDKNVYNITINYTSPNGYTKFAKADNEIDWWNAQCKHWKSSQGDKNEYCLLNIPMNVGGKLTLPKTQQHNDKALGLMIKNKFNDILDINTDKPTFTDIHKTIDAKIKENVKEIRNFIDDLPNPTQNNQNLNLYRKLINNLREPNENGFYNYGYNAIVKHDSIIEKLIEIQKLYQSFSNQPIKHLPAALIKFSKAISKIDKKMMFAIDGHCKSGKDRAGIAALNAFHTIMKEQNNINDEPLENMIQNIDFAPWRSSESAAGHKGYNIMMRNMNQKTPGYWSFSFKALITLFLITEYILFTMIALPFIPIAGLAPLVALTAPFIPVIGLTLAAVTLITIVTAAIFARNNYFNVDQKVGPDYEQKSKMGDGKILNTDTKNSNAEDPQMRDGNTLDGVTKKTNNTLTINYKADYTKSQNLNHGNDDSNKEYTSDDDSDDGYYTANNYDDDSDVDSDDEGYHTANDDDGPGIRR
ncbi:MAG: hypothetical protein ACON5A_00360 [Candidatus Comchoanobacterales bacterium]